MHCVKLMCMYVEYLVDALCKTNVYVYEYLVDVLCKTNVYVC